MVFDVLVLCVFLIYLFEKIGFQVIGIVFFIVLNVKQVKVEIVWLLVFELLEI